MPERRERAYAFLLDTDSAEIARVVEEALRSASIPHQAGVQSTPEPKIVFAVPADRLEEARAVVRQFFGAGPLTRDEDEEEPTGRREELEQRFPRGPVATCLGLILLHLGFVWVVIGPDPTPARLVTVGGLVQRALSGEPWRLLTSLFVHSSTQHVLWNGLSMIAFAVPLVLAVGYTRTVSIYLVCGVAGGFAALFTCQGCVTVGSSGAVAGLFGAWLVRALREARHAPPTARAGMKVIGIGLLVLPSLLTPATASGTRISVASHVGGALAGVLLGLFGLSGPPPRRAPERLVH